MLPIAEKAALEVVVVVVVVVEAAVGRGRLGGVGEK